MPEPCRQDDVLLESGEEETEEEEYIVSDSNSEISEVVDDNDDDKNKNTFDSFNQAAKNNRNDLRFSLSNARSLAKKITSLVDLFREKSLHFAMVTETWLRNNRETQNKLLDIKHAEKIEVICKNRGRRGGGVAIAFDSTVSSFKPLRIRGNKFELIAAVGRTATDSRSCVIFVVYIPPKQTVSMTSELFQCLGNAIEQVKLDYSDPYIVIGGDTNRRDISDALLDFPDITVAQTGPTRGNATLDIIATISLTS